MFFPGTHVDVKAYRLAPERVGRRPFAQEGPLERSFDHHLLGLHLKRGAQKLLGRLAFLVKQLQQLQILFDLGGFGPLRKHGVQVDHVRLLGQRGQAVQGVGRCQPYARGNVGQLHNPGGPLQTIVQQGGNHRIAFKHQHPKTAGGEQETVATEACGGVNQQRLGGVAHLGRLSQQLLARMEQAPAGGGAVEIHPQGAGQRRIAQFAQFQMFRRQTEQQTFGGRGGDQRNVEGLGQAQRPVWGARPIGVENKGEGRDGQGCFPL